MAILAWITQSNKTNTDMSACKWSCGLAAYWIMRWSPMPAMILIFMQHQRGLSWSCSCVVVSVFLLSKLASKHAFTNGGRLPSHFLGSLNAKLVASLCPLIWNIMAAWCVVAVEAQKAECEQEERFSARCNSSHRPIMAVTVILRPPWSPTPGF